MSAISQWLDRLLMYQTPKVVRVRERSLRLLQFAFMGAIFLYCLTKVIVIDEAYYIKDIPVGTTQINFAEDLIAAKFKDLSYCHGAYSGPDPWTNKFPKETYPCRLWDSTQLRAKNNLNRIFIPTAARDQLIYYKCGLENTEGKPDVELECDVSFPNNDTAAEIYFLTAADYASFAIAHQFEAPNFVRISTTNRDYSGYSGYYAGRLLDKDGVVIKEFASHDDFDNIFVTDLYRAAGVSLTDRVVFNDDLVYSRRMSGMILVATIFYSNRNGATTYTYRVKAFPQPGYSTADLIFGTDWKAPRRHVDLTGTLVLFEVSGEIVRFDFQNLLIQLVSAAVLLSLSSILTDFVMLSVLPMRHLYEKAKYEDTEDFQELRARRAEMQQHLLEELNTSLGVMRAQAQVQVELTPTSPSP